MGLVTADAMRAERAEAAYWATYARNIPTTDDTRDTGAVPVAGGYAICLQGSSIDYGLGVGTSRPLREDDLRIVDEFYGSRGLTSQLELHPLIAERDAALLADWGYAPERTVALLERELDADVPLPERFAVEIMTSRRGEWTDLINSAMADALPGGDARRLRWTTSVCAQAASALIGIRVNGQLAGGGALGVTGDVAFLYCAATLPAYRRQGVHGASIAARVALGRSRGATFAFTAVPVESAAVASAERAGLQRTYVRQRFRKRITRLARPT